MTIGEPSFIAVDFGDTIRVSKKTCRDALNIDIHEANQCLLLHLVAGVQWIREKKHGIPVSSQVMQEDEEWRCDEIAQSKLAPEQYTQRDDHIAQELAIIAHDVVSAGHGRDYRSISVFFQGFSAAHMISVRVFDLRTRKAGGYEMRVSFSQALGGGDWPVVDLLAFNHHMRWLKPRTDALDTVKSGRKEFFRAYLQVFSVEGWTGKCMGVADDRTREGLHMCRFCRLMVKTNSTSEVFYGRFLKESAICGHTEETQFDWHAGWEDGSFPILDMDWRITGEVASNAQNFLDVADVPYSVDAAKAAVEAGNKLDGNYADIRLAARNVQGIRMRSIAVLSHNARELLSDEPVLGEEIARLHELGALPHYGGPSPGAWRVSGLPYDESKTTLMVSKLWKEVRKGRVLVVHAGAIPVDMPLIPTPTTTVVKKLPDRTISTDVRIISDSRMANMFRDKTDYPEIYLTDNSEVATRAITTKRTWPNVKVVCCKRDIDSAFKRARTHPDMCALLRAEFSGRFFDMAGNIYFLYLALPFGWRGSPAYFSSVGRGISVARKNPPLPNKLRGGPHDMRSLLFVDDAIFIEPLVGERPEIVGA